MRGGTSASRPRARRGALAALLVAASLAGGCGSSSVEVDAAVVDAAPVDAEPPRVFFVDPAAEAGGDGRSWETAFTTVPAAMPGRFYLRAGEVTAASILRDVELRGGQPASLTGTDVEPAPTESTEVASARDSVRLVGTVDVADVALAWDIVVVDGDLRLERTRLDATRIWQASATGRITGDRVTASRDLSGLWGSAHLTRVSGTFGVPLLELMKEPGTWSCEANVCHSSTTVGHVDRAQITDHMVATIVSVDTPGARACFRHGDNRFYSIILTADDPGGPWTVRAHVDGSRVRACHQVGDEAYVAFAFYRGNGHTPRHDLGASGVPIPGLGTTHGLFVANKANSGTVTPILWLPDRVIHLTIDVLATEDMP